MDVDELAVGVGTLALASAAASTSFGNGSTNLLGVRYFDLGISGTGT